MPLDIGRAGRLCDMDKTKRCQAVPPLGKRLLLCASMVRQNSKIADIGTDHAYLPIYLAKNKAVSSAIASDVREDPLKIAGQNISRFAAENMVHTRLSDGLMNISPFEADDIVIAGMGGKNIINIIKPAKWLKNANKHLILQPMTSEPELRVFLSDEGFSVKKEEAAEEGSHIYTAMLAAFKPENTKKDELFPYIGAIKPDTHANINYILKQMHRLQKRAGGLRISGRQFEAESAEKIISRIQDILNQI